MEEQFYKTEELMALLEESEGEKLVFIGLDTDESGNMLLFRHIYLNSMKFIDSYIYKGGVLDLVGHLPINIQISHMLYKEKYKVVIDN